MDIKDKEDIIKEIEELDRLSIRPLRAMMIGTGNSADVHKLKQIEQKIEVLRTLLQEVKG